MKSTKQLIFLVQIVLFSFLFNAAKGQELPRLSYFMNNKIIYNPASAGTGSSQFSAGFVARLQWTGVEGAPTNNIFYADYRFVPQNMAIGFSVYQDKIGGYSSTNYQAYYAYKINLNRVTKISFGLSAGANSLSFSSEYIKLIWDDNDTYYQNSLYNTVVPKFGFGVQLYSDKYYISLAAPDLIMLGNVQYLGISNGNFFQKKRNFTAQGGYNFKISDKYSLRSYTLWSYFPTNGLIVDLNTQLHLNDYFWLGATYSTSSTHCLMAGTQLSSRLRFGYAYNFSTKNSNVYSLTTHEVNLILMLDKILRPSTN